jgi:hypothetical protein
MSKIYISSTYQDLRSAREAVYKVLRKLGHDVISMEDYVACDERPLGKCLADVSQCDIYVGIIAWRYGYIPPSQSSSITELEFRMAQSKKICCLLFLLDESAPWPRNEMDKDTTRIEAFRSELMTDFLVSTFTTSEELGSLVSVAVAQSKKSLKGQNRVLKKLKTIRVDDLSQLEYLVQYGSRIKQIAEGYNAEDLKSLINIQIPLQDLSEKYSERQTPLEQAGLKGRLDLMVDNQDTSTECFFECKKEIISFVKKKLSDSPAPFLQQLTKKYATCIKEWIESLEYLHSDIVEVVNSHLA